MSKSNFTPGPWGVGESQKANSDLIAAAPEMYQMLERILDYMTGGPILAKKPNVEEIAHLLEKARGER